MGIALAVIGAVLVIAFVVWFFVVRAPEDLASHDDSLEADREVERSHFAPTDAGTEDQAVPRSGEPGPAA